MRVEAGGLVRAAAQNFGSRVALTAGVRHWSFTELNELANRVGSALADLGVARGDRVGVLAHNTPEVVARSAMSLGEYWAMPERTAQSFFPHDWFRTYDIGYLDEDGFLYYLGRAVDRITTAHGIVHPHLVEEAILGHGSVFLSGVVGLGEPGSEEVVAGVQLKPGVAPSEELAAQIVRQTAGLPEHERPVRVIFVGDMPTVLGGAKVQRQALRERLQAQREPGKPG